MNADASHLPPLIRLAIASALSEDRAVFEDVFLLDNRLASIVRGRREPIVAQLKLAWWRDRFAQPPQEWPKGEPLLERLATWPVDLGLLGELVDGWELLLAEALSDQMATDFAGGRGAAWVATANAIGEDTDENGIQLAGMRWALADIAENLSDPAERHAIQFQLEQVSQQPISLPRRLRPFAILSGVAKRKAKRPEQPMDRGLGNYLASMRLGIIGR